MTTILCPTRGGEASYPNQDKAIALAKERQADLVFMYIYNIQFLSAIGSPVLADMEEEMDDLGEFLLAMAQERADKAGISAEAVVQHGSFSSALIECVENRQIDTVVIGSAATDQSYTNESIIENLVSRLQTATGVEVIMVSDGEVVKTYPKTGSPPDQA